MGDDFTREGLAWVDQVNSDTSLSDAASRLAFHLYKHFNRKRYGESGVFSAWPSHETLADKTGWSVSKVKRAIEDLKRAKYLATKGKGGRNCSLTYYPVLRNPNTINERKEETREAENRAVKLAHPRPSLEKTAQKYVQNQLIREHKLAQIRPVNQLTDELLTSLNRTSLNNLADTGASAREVDAATSPARAPIAVVVLSLLIEKPVALPPLPPFCRGREDQFPQIVLDHQANHGWPDLLTKCLEPRRRNAGLSLLALEMEPVADGCEQWQAWKAEYRRRGWPMPVAEDGIACFPQGGPRHFDLFLSRVAAAKLNVRVMASANVIRMGARL